MSLRRKLFGGFSPVEFVERHLLRVCARAGMTSEQIEVGSASVHTWVGGSGPPLLLLHGFGPSAEFQYHRQLIALTKRFKVFLPDLLFFGRSVSSEPRFDLAYQAETMLALLDHYRVERFDVAGLSYGGFVSYFIQSMAPERVRRLVLSNSPGPAMVRSDYEALLETYEIGCITELLLPTDALGVRRLIEVAYHQPPRVPRFALQDALQHFFSHQIEAKRGLLLDLISLLEDPPDLGIPENPTLLVWGRHDGIFPVDLAERLRDYIGPTARLAILEKAAHAPNVERSRTFNRLLIEFLERS